MSVLQWFTDPANWSGPNGIPARTLEQVLMSTVAMLLALAVALPVALTLGHLRRGVGVASSVSSIGRAVPTLGLLIIFASIPSIGVGSLAAVLALALFAIPPLMTNAFAGMAAVPPDVLDAGAAMGMRAPQRLAGVELPLAAPLVLAGIRTAGVQVVATASLAALVGGGGLGRYVVDGFALQDTTLILAGAILTAALALVTEGLLALLERAATPRGLRSLADQAQRAAVEPATAPPRPG